MAKNFKIALISARFNQMITNQLVEGAKETFLKQGGLEQNLSHTWVPGAFEIPTVASLMTKQQRYDAILTLGAVIKGETQHFEYVCGPLAHALAEISWKREVPILFGVLTTENLDQALARSGGDKGNKGSETMLAALEMAHLCQELRAR